MYTRWNDTPPIDPRPRRRAGLLWLGLGVAAIVASFVLFTVTPPSEPLPPTTPADVRGASDPGELAHPYLSFQCKKIVDPKVHRAGRGYRNRPWQAYYYLLPVEDRFIVATSDTPIRPGLIQGKIVRWNAPVNLGALQSIYSTMPAYRDKITAVQLDIGDYTDPPAVRGWPAAFILLGIVGGVAVLVGLYKVFTSLPESAPAPAPVAEAPRWSFLPPPR